MKRIWHLGGMYEAQTARAERLTLIILSTMGGEWQSDGRYLPYTHKFLLFGFQTWPPFLLPLPLEEEGKGRHRAGIPESFTFLGFLCPDGQHTLVCWNSWWVAGVLTCRYCPSLQSWTSPFQNSLIQVLSHCYLCCSSLPAGGYLVYTF